MISKSFSVLSIVFLLLILVFSSVTEAATPTFYPDRASFEAALATVVTDDYSPASGYPAGFGVYTNAAMSAYFGETDYQSTGFNNVNIVGGAGPETYCAGCNDSFLLSFATTSVTQGTGVFGVGVDIILNAPALPYFAYITYGDGTTDNIALPAGASFFAVTAPELIQSIHFGLSGGVATLAGSFAIDNLTIGDPAPVAPVAPAIVPTMNEWGMIIFVLLAGLGSVYLIEKRKKNTLS